jgi:hypothetical protein
MTRRQNIDTEKINKHEDKKQWNDSNRYSEYVWCAGQEKWYMSERTRSEPMPGWQFV